MTTKPRRAALYVRVSSSDQNTENQSRELEAVAARHGWEIVARYADDGISGAKGRDQRPGFDALCKAIARREFDLVATWSVDRLGRSLQDLVTFLGEVHGKKIDLYLHQQGLDTTTPTGKAMFQLAGVFGEFERSMIVARVNAGLARARATGLNKKGKKLVLGRPSSMTPAKAVEARTMLASGVGILKVAKTLGVGTGTIQKIKRELLAA